MGVRFSLANILAPSLKLGFLLFKCFSFFFFHQDFLGILLIYKLYDYFLRLLTVLITKSMTALYVARQDIYINVITDLFSYLLLHHLCQINGFQ